MGMDWKLILEPPEKPGIKAEFKLDTNGKPVTRAITDGIHHYEIVLSIDKPPVDTYAVTYFLHETYYDPVLESQDKAANFAVELTSYGDYEIKAKIRARSITLIIARQLYDALFTSHGATSDPDIKSALENIAKN